MSTASTTDSHNHTSGGFSHFIWTYVFSKDHKIIGLQFLFSTLVWFLIGGLLALAMRWQIAWPWGEGAPFGIQGMPILGNLFFAEQGS